jgi:hypothetical protein
MWLLLFLSPFTGGEIETWKLTYGNIQSHTFQPKLMLVSFTINVS